ncbi:hypothetical protein D3C72_2112580 [compost metagenome]
MSDHGRRFGQDELDETRVLPHLGRQGNGLGARLHGIQAYGSPLSLGDDLLRVDEHIACPEFERCCGQGSQGDVRQVIVCLDTGHSHQRREREAGWCHDAVTQRTATNSGVIACGMPVIWMPAVFTLYR